MEDVADRILDAILPREPWKNDTRPRLKEVALTMLDEMDEDTVEECLTTVVSVIQAEYGE